MVALNSTAEIRQFTESLGAGVTGSQQSVHVGATRHACHSAHRLSETCASHRRQRVGAGTHGDDRSARWRQGAAGGGRGEHSRPQQIHVEVHADAAASDRRPLGWRGHARGWGADDGHREAGRGGGAYVVLHTQRARRARGGRHRGRGDKRAARRKRAAAVAAAAVAGGGVSSSRCTSEATLGGRGGGGGGRASTAQRWWRRSRGIPARSSP